MAAKMAEKHTNRHISTYTSVIIQIVGSKSMLSYIRSKNINVSRFLCWPSRTKSKMASKNVGKTYKSAYLCLYKILLCIFAGLSSVYTFSNVDGLFVLHILNVSTKLVFFFSAAIFLLWRPF